MKAPGATPGRVGRCPNCGGRSRCPTCRPRKLRLKQPREAAESGYRLEPENEASVHVPSRSRPVPDLPPRGTFVERKRPTPMADGFLPALDRPETSWFASISYPLRGAESLGVIAATSRSSGSSPSSYRSIAWP